jgi:hypothetical protein
MGNWFVKLLPIAAGLAMGWLLMASPAWFSGLGPARYLVGVGIVFAGLVGLVALMIVRNLPREPRLTPVSQPVPDDVAAIAIKFRELGFAEAGSLLEVNVSPPALLLPLVNEQERTYGSIFRTGTLPATTACDLVSIFERVEGGLTTGALPGGASLPSGPGELRQVIVRASVLELFEAHRQALSFLQQQGIRARPALARTFVDDFKAGMLHQRRTFLARPLRNTIIALVRSATLRTPHRGPLSAQKIALRQIRQLKASGS